MRGPLSLLVTDYIERVVNRRDTDAIEDLVSAEYNGSGPDWPTTISELRQFYRQQAQDRPDWHIEIRETLELGDSVIVLARAGGHVMVDGVPEQRRLDWLAHYRLHDGLIAEINLLTYLPVPDRSR